MMDNRIYTAAFVSNLFNQMSGSYERMNTLTSFGFYPLWRQQAVKKIALKPGDHVADLMTGIGECWSAILKKIGPEGCLTALDFSEGMLAKAQKRSLKYSSYQIHILQESVFNNSIPDSSQDAVICAYGMKTFTHEQIRDFSKEVHRILKPGGSFSLVDVSLPKPRSMRALYLFYISKVIPFLSRLFTTSEESYKMLGIYSKNFQNAQKTALLFKESGLKVSYCEYFFGCATGIYGQRPLN
ncbi:class I SAM-dependent methyltransferase [Ascidiimonas aurantiaca]|uniref:class I SAM-dependent methyltransferase n=1 Tax=Ascidiimonas aurantiaca TaxID=1685432 RepID=UPI0030EF7EF6